MNIGKLSAVLLLLVSVTISSSLKAQETFPSSRPNILLLVAEDMSARVGAFGDEVAVTPNIDQLASQGIRYPNTFTTSGVCAPSRAALITGMHQISLGAQHMRTSKYGPSEYTAIPPAQVKAFPELLRRAGYYTFTDRKLDYQFSGIRSGSGPFSIWDDEGGEASWEGRQTGQPFFGMINFMHTHESGLFPRPALPRNMTHLTLQAFHLNLHAGVEGVVEPKSVVVPPYYPDTATVRKDIAQQYNNIYSMDIQVGNILTQLERDGLSENTIVIWTTDHGDGLPRAKREIYDSGIKVPMVVYWPEAYRPETAIHGSVDERLISFVDLAPTILKVAGVPRPAYLHGAPFFPVENNIAREYIYASKDRMDTAYDRQRAVRDKHFKYIRNYYPEKSGYQKIDFRENIDSMREMEQLYQQGKLGTVQQLWFSPRSIDELYDIQKDPHEVHNLAQDRQYQEQLQTMKLALDSWLKTIKDWGELDEPEMIAQFWPGGKQPVTRAPTVERNTGPSTVSLRSPDEGASIGYKLNNGQWKLYTKPVVATPGDTLYAKAIRYGWKESDIQSFILEGE